MKKHSPVSVSLATILVLAVSAALVPSVAHARKIVETATVGGYSVTLKVLPAESFLGPHAAMARDSGAQPALLKGPLHPNHHLVAFIRKDRKPVEHAAVTISYRKLSPEKGGWMDLPVVRMHVAGKGLQTTHFGNNVKLAPGRYEVRVTVDGKGPALFLFSLR